MNIKGFSIIAGILLLLGIVNFLPYDFYIFLRWVVCGLALTNTYGFYKAKLIGWALVFGAISYLFNPLFPVYMNKSSWIGIDFVSAILFFLAAYSIKVKTK